MLVGNKLDKLTTATREVTEVEAQDFAKKHDILFKEASAMDSTNVDSAFLELLEKIDDNRLRNQKKGVVRGAPTGGTHLGGAHFGTLEERSNESCGC